MDAKFQRGTEKIGTGIGSTGIMTVFHRLPETITEATRHLPLYPLQGELSNQRDVSMIVCNFLDPLQTTMATGP